MKNRRTRFLAWLLTAVMTVGIMPAEAFAAGYEEPEETVFGEEYGDEQSAALDIEYNEENSPAEEQFLEVTTGSGIHIMAVYGSLRRRCRAARGNNPGSDRRPAHAGE